MMSDPGNKSFGQMSNVKKSIVQPPMFISGIQQVGVGVSNVHEAFKWYRRHFGMDVPIFEYNIVNNVFIFRK